MTGLNMWSQTRTPKNDRYTTYISAHKNGDMHAVLSVEHLPDMDGGDIFNVHTRTRYKSDALIQMHTAPTGSLKIGNRNFKTLELAERYLKKWIKDNP